MTLIGIVAGLLTTICWLPQLIRSFRTGSTADISWPYLCTLTAGVALWVVYGSIKGDLPVILTNAGTGVALGVLVALKAGHTRHAALLARVGSAVPEKELAS